MLNRLHPARHSAALLVPFAPLVPPVGMLTPWLVQGERPGPAEAIGGVLLLGGWPSPPSATTTTPASLNAASARP